MDNDRKTYNTILALLKGRGTFACIVGLFLALVIGRGVTEVFNSNSTPQAIANFIASVIVFALVIGIAVLFRKNGKELFEGADEEPPFGRAPSMPEHYQKFYEGKELKPNSFGELVPVDDSPIPKAPRTEGSAKPKGKGRKRFANTRNC